MSLSDAEFWAITPAQLFALWDAWNERVKRDDFRTGVITLVVRQIMGDKKAKVFDYFPQHEQNQSPNNLTSPEVVRARLRAFMNHQDLIGGE